MYCARSLVIDRLFSQLFHSYRSGGEEAKLFSDLECDAIFFYARFMSVCCYRRHNIIINPCMKIIQLVREEGKEQGKMFPLLAGISLKLPKGIRTSKYLPATLQGLMTSDSHPTPERKIDDVAQPNVLVWCMNLLTAKIGIDRSDRSVRAV